MAQGMVKWFSDEKGYGFISLLGGDEAVFVEDFSVRNSRVASAGSRMLEGGERVAYQVTQDKWGLRQRTSASYSVAVLVTGSLQRVRDEVFVS